MKILSLACDQIFCLYSPLLPLPTSSLGLVYGWQSVPSGENLKGTPDVGEGFRGGTFGRGSQINVQTSKKTEVPVPCQYLGFVSGENGNDLTEIKKVDISSNVHVQRDLIRRETASSGKKETGKTTKKTVDKAKTAEEARE